MHTPGATRPALSCRGLRDGLYRQPLHLRATAVPRDSGGAGVHDIPDARHGQRRLGDVGREHDPAAGVGREDPLLFGGGKPSVKRQHLRVLHVTQCVCGVADLALTGKEDQHVAGWFLVELVYRVDDGLGLIAHLGAHDLVVGVVRIVVV
jgi:hypothetical protein